MKKHINAQFFVTLILICTLFSGCIKDTCHRTYTDSYYIPVYRTTEEVKANIKSNSPKDIQNPGKIFLLGNYIFLNEIDKGVHIIDNTNPASPQNVAFIDIPGNMDLAVKENILYADAYTDLVTIDVTNPLKVVIKKYNEGVFPFRIYSNGFVANTQEVIVDWIKKDTLITEDCSNYSPLIMDASVFYLSNAAQNTTSSKASASPVGLGGSMARFALLNNYLYTVSDDKLNAFNITHSSSPIFSNSIFVGWNIETIYPFKDKLFIGSNNGMFIYTTESSPSNPVKIGEFAHARACDPVIADDNFAFVTLRTGTACRGFNNELDVIKLNNLVDAALARTYNFSIPHGLSKDGNILFICDDTAGLKVYNAADPMNLQLIKEFTDVQTYDVIAYNKIALVVGKDGLYQYDYSDLTNIHFISKTGFLK